MPDPDDPHDVAGDWRRLAKADELVQAFGERGWIHGDALASVEARTTELARRAGRPAHDAADDRRLVSDLRQATALLVALADVAVAAQPSLAPATPVPVTLAQAEQRLEDTDAAYRHPG